LRVAQAKGIVRNQRLPKNQIHDSKSIREGDSTMAVSQFLRPGGLMEAVKGYLTPDVLRGASSLTGESEASTSKALGGVVPTLLGGITGMASSEKGASSLMGLVHSGGYTSALDNPTSFFGGGSTQKMMGAGQQLVESIFGNRSSSISNELARTANVKPSSATALLSLAAPLVMGVIGKHVATHGLDAGGLSSLLASQKNEFASAMPSGMSKLIEGAGPVEVPKPVATESYRGPASTETYREPVREVRRDAYSEPMRTEGSSKKWLFWLIPLALILLGWMMFRGRTANVSTGVPSTLSTVTLPGGASISTPQGSINDQLAQYLGNPSAQVPQTFVFDHLNFVSGTTQLTSESANTVNSLSTVLKAYPNAQIQLAGHTDNTGDPNANHVLSSQRADAVKASLVNSGVGGERISTTGYGQDKPIASNDTEEGKAQNRRLELTVIQK
jgi:OmpA-OmpF porin, OOP family